MEKKYIYSLAVLLSVISIQKIKVQAVLSGRPKLFNLSLDKVLNPGRYNNKIWSTSKKPSVSPLVLDSSTGVEIFEPVKFQTKKFKNGDGYFKKYIVIKKSDSSKLSDEPKVIITSTSTSTNSPTSESSSSIVRRKPDIRPISDLIKQFEKLNK